MKKLLIASATILTVAGTISYGLTKPSSIKADEQPPIVTQVNRHEEQLANHEARITNTENDVSDIQKSTGTQPSSNRTPVPPVTTQPTSQPTTQTGTSAVAVTNSSIELGGEHDGYCALTYSDGTKGYTKATITIVDKGNGQFGSTNNCGDFIGNTKD